MKFLNEQKPRWQSRYRNFLRAEQSDVRTTAGVKKFLFSKIVQMALESIQPRIQCVLGFLT